MTSTFQNWSHWLHLISNRVIENVMYSFNYQHIKCLCVHVNVKCLLMRTCIVKLCTEQKRTLNTAALSIMAGCRTAAAADRSSAWRKRSVWTYIGGKPTNFTPNMEYYSPKPYWQIQLNWKLQLLLKTACGLCKMCFLLIVLRQEPTRNLVVNNK